MIRSALAALVLGTLLPGAAPTQPAQGAIEPTSPQPAPPRNCRVLAQQPEVRPTRPSRADTSMTLVVIVPATTCNTR